MLTFLYTGENFLTMNVHLLSHLHECVLDWGPLWAYSCFYFEGMNGQLKRFFHGTREMNKQVKKIMSIALVFSNLLAHSLFQLAFCYTMSQILPSLLSEQRSVHVQGVMDVLLNKERCVNCHA